MPYVVSNNPSKSSRIQVQVKWSKTQPGWVKINTYGFFFLVIKGRLEEVGFFDVAMGTGLLGLRGSLVKPLVIWRKYEHSGMV